jgi:ABC-type molybdate transport system substrate-binding protein
VKRLWLGLGLALGGSAGLGLLLMSESRPRTPSTSRPLLVYCAAGMRVPVEKAARAYEAETGGRVELQYGGSQTLIANLEVSGKGDLYVPADDAFMEAARKRGLVAESLPLARMSPVLAVRKGNPKRLVSAADLLREDVRLVQASPDAAAMGILVRGVFRRSGVWDAMAAKTAAFKPTVNDVANDLKLGTADAGFIWDANLPQYPDLERVDLPELKGAEGAVSVGVCRGAAPGEALRFARWLAASDRGLKEFAAAGFRPAAGDPWAPSPKLTFYAGAMLKAAVEPTIREFEAREGVVVTRVYNGCGILVAGMKTGEKADVYFACDTSFLDMVKEKFAAPVDVTLNQLVILVKKGNPHGIRSLKDLGKPGLRVGVGNERQCALGALTSTALRESKVFDAVMKNVVTTTPTGDLLANQMRVGQLDAAVTYLSNAAGSGDVLEGVPVDLPCALATQPLAVAADTPHGHLARRLVDALAGARSRSRFEAEGFRWKASP